ncbi:hypothetical protein [Thermomonospora umbrina]|uniref:Uncharacterized protein n=1 Tax=Thermomonospora umbrina TaxID=111806 RepID=A0A3D9SZ56_9ACTN|nr:hypothetical protein [Thermomonospora umbrina]REE96901.1 hypothetical protein DFJ69_2354 [Thermomonospora umbrina]
MTETDLRTRLHELADSDTTAPRVDLALARRRGRRLRRRRALMVTAPATAIAVAASVLLSGGDGGSTPPPEALRPAASPLPNPLTRQVTFGWLPKYYKLTGRDLENGWTHFRAYGKAGDDGVAQLFVTLFPEGPAPSLGKMRGGVQAVPIPVEPVGGREAHWMQPPPPGAGSAPGEGRLRVRFRPRQWGEIEINDTGMSSEEITRTLRKAAAGVRLSEEPARFPVEISGFPSGLTVETARPGAAARPGSEGIARLVMEETALNFAQGLYITVTRAGAMDGKHSRKPNTTIDGHRAYHLAGTATTRPGHEAAEAAKLRDRGGPLRPEDVLVGTEYLCVYRVNGMDVCMSTSPPMTEVYDERGGRVVPQPNWASEILKPSGGLVGLYRRTKVLGTDSTKWSTTPFLR